MKQFATFYFANGSTSTPMETEKGITLLEEVVTGMESDKAILTIALFENSARGTIFVVKSEALTGVALSVAPAKKKKKKKKKKDVATPEPPAAPADAEDTEEDSEQE